MRIAVGGIATESCTFSPLPTRLQDFDILTGAALAERHPFFPQFAEVSFVPLLRARAMPGGPVDASAYAQIKDRFLDLLRAHGPWDGVYLDMHGATYVQGMEDAEGDWTAAVREVVGPDCLIAASYDLHGNVSRRVMEHLDVLTAFRTAPHVDAVETCQRACTLLVTCLRQGIRPHKAFIPVPILMPGEKATTSDGPGAALYALIPEVTHDEGVMDASVLVGYTWADEPRSRASVVTLGTDEDAVRRAALRLARAYWDRRQAFQFNMPTAPVDACIRAALDAEEPCVFISDAGDNVTGGGAGDVPYLLGRLIALHVPDAVYASIADAAAVDACFRAGLGAGVALSLGGKLDPVHGQPLDVSGQVIALETPEPGNRQAVVQVGGVKAVVTGRRMAFTTVAQFQRLGLEPLAHKIVSVKLGYLFPDLQRIASRAWMALSPGAIDPLVERLPFRRVARPVYPLDPGMAWDPADELGSGG